MEGIALIASNEARFDYEAAYSVSNYSDLLIDFCFLCILRQALKISINAFIPSLSEVLGERQHFLTMK